MVRWHTTTRVASAVASALIITGCTVNGAFPAGGTAGPSSPADAGRALPVGHSDAPMPAPGTCTAGSRAGQPLPDHHCTPGAVNPDVTQSDIKRTICKVGWTKTVRPPESKTRVMKVKSARSYGLGRSERSEYDHLVPLELGGAPDDPRNLWVEVGKIPNPKDAVEHKLNDAVCSGLVPLAAAQKAIAANWVTAFDAVGLRVSGGKVCLRDDPSRCADSRHGGRSSGD